MLSVTMPFYQRQEALEHSFAAYNRIYPTLDLEFSICDDGSPDPVIAYGCKVTSLPVKSFPLNPCVPINRAVNASKGDVIVLTNPEIEHMEPTFEAMLGMLVSPMDYVVATCKDVTTGQLLAGDGVDYSQDGRLPVPVGAHFHFCAMFYRSLWNKAGGFDESYRRGQACDDNDWLWRLNAAGAIFKTCSSVVWHHRIPLRWGLPHNRDLFFSKWPQCAS